MVEIGWRLALFSVLFILFSAAALAAVNCNPPANGDWIFNASNSTLVCDDGSAVVLNGSLILLDNATVTFANGTALNATSIQLSNGSSSLLFVNGSATNATLVMSAGSAVGAFLTLAAGSSVYDSSYARLVQGNVSVNVSGSSLYTGAGNVTLAAINATAAPSYVLLDLTADGTIRNGQLTLSLTPYTGLVAGTYSGTYGFGVLG